MISIADRFNSELIRDSAYPPGHQTAGASMRHSREMDRRIAREHIETLLDAALGETFPASDSIAITPGKRDSK